MELLENTEHQTSPVTELVAPVVFIGGVFTFLMLLSAFVG